MPGREQVEELLYLEASLLDEWRLGEWLELLTPDVTYLVPSTDAREGDPATTLSIIADDAARLRARVDQLLGKYCWSESPPSRTRRLISNVRIRSRAPNGVLEVSANFAVYRFRHEVMEVYVGRYDYTLLWAEGGLKIRSRKAILDLESLRPHGKLSIIL
jgi:p-cumate 2,3-dioxygenase subunit beta